MKENQKPKNVRDKYKIPENASLCITEKNVENPIQNEADNKVKELIVLEDEKKRIEQEKRINRIVAEFREMLKIGLEHGTRETPYKVDDIMNRIMPTVEDRIKSFVNSTENGFNNLMVEVVGIVNMVNKSLSQNKEETPEEIATRLKPQTEIDNLLKELEERE